MKNAALVNLLANLDAYDRWAENYPPMPHNPLMRAEQKAMTQLWPSAVNLIGARALDLACGTGRYSVLLMESGASQVVAMDLSTAMLQHSHSDARVRADMMRLPFTDAAFDIVVSGLAVGHAPQIESWMRGIARVLKPGGALLYSDFHPDAAAAGMTRSFTDAQNRKHILLHRRYDVSSHQSAAAAAGLKVEMLREIRVGQDLHEEFEGSEAFYRRWQGLPVVLVVRARKLHPCQTPTAAV